LDKAQREFVQCCMSDWGKIQGDEIRPVVKSRGPNSNALAYAERTMST